MVLVIDASNIITGGGLTHLREILRSIDVERFGFKKIIVCASSVTLQSIDDRHWLKKYSHPYLNRSYFYRALWAIFILPELLRYNNGFLFLIGSIKYPFTWPYVTMCQNQLPLEWGELRRFGFSKTTLRLIILRVLHLDAYVNSEGVIFLTQYSYDVLPPRIKKRIRSHQVIPHGINHELFKSIERPPIPTAPGKFDLLYISIINVYKHQYNVAKAVININRRGHALRLNLIGPAYRPSLRRLNKLVRKEKAEDIIVYKGPVSYTDSVKEYERNDAFIFASSCETFGMILTEAIATGIPIACSNRSSLPETMRDVPVYFDPESVESIELAILRLLLDPDLRAEVSAKGLKRAEDFQWIKCAFDTFGYLSEMGLKWKHNAIQYHNTESGVFQEKYLDRQSFISRLNLWDQLIRSQATAAGLTNSMDIGCGPGYMTRILSEISKEVVAIDGSETMIANAKKLLSENTNVDYHQMEITPSSLKRWDDGTFDLIIMSSVIEYLDDAEEIMEQIGRLLSKNGRLIFSIPNEESLFRKIEFRLNRWTGLPAYRSLIRNIWTRNQTLKVLKRSGMKADQTIFHGSVPIYSQLFFWLPKRYRTTMIIVIGSK